MLAVPESEASYARSTRPMTDVMPVTDTALVTLWCRASEARRADAIVDDPMAIRLVDSMDYDFSKFKLSADRQDLALRALAFDNGARGYLSAHPKATVVALGEGLQTSFWRLDAAGLGSEFRWLTVDFPPNIALREQLLPDSARMSACGQSVLDFSWMDQVDAQDGVFITAEGLLPYLEPSEALDLIPNARAASRRPDDVRPAAEGAGAAGRPATVVDGIARRLAEDAVQPHRARARQVGRHRARNSCGA